MLASAAAPQPMHKKVQIVEQAHGQPIDERDRRREREGAWPAHWCRVERCRVITPKENSPCITVSAAGTINPGDCVLPIRSRAGREIEEAVQVLEREGFHVQPGPGDLTEP